MKFPPSGLRKGLALVATASLLSSATVPVQATLTASSAQASATTYYVDSLAGDDANAGTSESAPFKSLKKASSLTLNAGDRLLLKGGSTWTGSLNVTGVGTETAPIIVGSYGQGRARINGNATVTNAVYVKNSQYLRVQDLEVTNSAAFTTSTNSIYRGIYVEAKDIGQINGIVIQNNYVHSVDGQGKSGGIGNGGIAVGVRGNSVPTWYSKLKITGNEVGDINAYGISTFTTWCANCQIYPNETGIPTSELSAQRRAFDAPVISDNYVHDTTGGGITPQYADNAVVEYNTVDRAASRQLVAGGGNVAIWWQGTNNILVQYNVVRRTGYTGLYTSLGAVDAQAFDADMGTTNSTVQFNVTEDNEGGFFMCLISSWNNQVRYNVSVNDKRRTFSLWSGCGNTRAYNNTIVGTSEPTATRTTINGETTPEKQEAWVRNQTGQSQLLFNNIFVNPAKATYRYQGDRTSSYSNNVYWENGTTASTPANDPTAMTLDPQFANPGVQLPADGKIGKEQVRAYLAGYVATNPDVLNKGITTDGQSADISGTPVPDGATDLGAFQHAVSKTLASPAPNQFEVRYGEKRTIDALTIAADPTNGAPSAIDVQTWDGSAWVSQLTDVPLTWSQNGGTQIKKVALPNTPSTDGLRVVAKTPAGVPATVSDIGASYRMAATGNLGERDQNSSAYLTDTNPATSWASTSTGQGYVQIDTRRITTNQISLFAHFGGGQGPTQVSIRARNGDNGAWIPVLSNATITWNSNSSTVEEKTLTFPAPVTATRFEIQITRANTTWGTIALNEVQLR
ncbi:discoidin domain-containing protein [Haematomicrobium sanguinis]|uniref:discoidin domain-containing protein n=1 Tax=Haematomicrobium sanguinis TaxID=479106 RepID=UPI0012FCFCE1|nr:discoidin domain-containing protein [Haematomicrobium sanguinis]